MKIRCLIISLLFLSGLASAADSTQTRKPAWAGQFYDADPARLAAQVDRFIRTGSPDVPGRRPLAIIAPHAGYVYSGETAGRAYAAAAGQDYETVVIIAPSHHVGFEGCSVDESDFLETPLGAVAVDRDVVRLLQKESSFGYVPKAHASEALPIRYRSAW